MKIKMFKIPAVPSFDGNMKSDDLTYELDYFLNFNSCEVSLVLVSFDILVNH